MADPDSLEALQGLHRDLLALSESRLPTLERLWAELVVRVEEFKKLLDKPRKSDRSREALKAAELDIDGEKYGLNDEFKQHTVRAADALDLDEIEAVKLCLAAREDSVDLDRSLFAASVIRFHKRRQFLLECLRLTLKQSTEPEANEELATAFGEYVRQVLGISGELRLENGHAYWQKCLASMGDIERWLQHLADSVLAGSVVGKAHTSEDMEILEFQRSSLTRQHESLAAICTHLIKAGYTSIDNFRGLLGTLKTLGKHDLVLVHYVPVVTSSIHQLVSSERSSSLEDARSLHKTIVSGKEGDGWTLRNFHAAVMVWWLAEYSGRYIDPAPLDGVDLDAEAEQRSQLFMDALKDGSFHFMLSVSQDIRPNRWYDPAKARLLSFVLQDAPLLPADSVQIEDFFQSLVMEQMQLFVDAFITNMPDTLRKLKVEEDDRRRLIHSRFQPGPVEQELHLERFLLVISYAFAGSPDAAQSFWQDTDGNLYGFLQWAAKRQTTPRVAAFCEMLKSLSEGEDCAAAAHRFLQEESAIASGKLRRTSSLSYGHVLSELQYYATSIHEKPAPAPAIGYQQPAQNANDHIVEPETAMMLECHLRLLSHLCRESSEARTWLLTNANFPLTDIVLKLAPVPMDSRLRACAFNVLSALLTGKTPQIGESLWSNLDHWVMNGAIPSAIQARNPAFANQERVFFDSVAENYDEATAFMGLLTALVAPYPEDCGLHDALPFPETLGSAYRMPGIDKYVDFALERVFDQLCKKIEDPLQLRVLRWHCLNFISICLSTFNEDLVVFANQTSISVDTAIHSSSLLAYVQLHPFARVMEWLFNNNVISSLFAAAHQDIAEVNDSTPDTPLLLSLVKAIEVLELVMKLQPTYLDIVRRIKSQGTNQKRPVANTALASFEDAVLNNLYIVVDLGLYCGTGHQDLTVHSLHLLQSLSSSRKLVVSPTAGFGPRSDRSKIIGIMEKNDDVERISKALTAEMELDVREFEIGLDAPGYAIKMGILSFLNSCLATIPNRPTVAHLLLGFSCGTSTVDIPDGGLFASGKSLFHSILRLAIEYPEMIDGSYKPWSSTIKQSCIGILMKLWRSPISSAFIMAELRASEYFLAQMLREHLVDGNTLFDGRDISDPDFIFEHSAAALEKFLQQRTAFYEYTARELRLVGGWPTLRARMQSTLLGLTVMPDGEQLPNPSVFDLFDFMELEVTDDYELPPLHMLGSLDFNICRANESPSGLQYNIPSVREMITLQSNELRKGERLLTPVEEQQLEAETQIVIGYLHGVNQRQNIALCKAEVLKAWVQLMMVVLEACEFEDTTKTSFILQALQVILPKLEKAYTEDVTTAIDLADLARTLLTNVDFKAKNLEEKTKTSDLAKDRLLQLFRVALGGIFCLVSNAELREICYQICYRYLGGIAKDTPKPATNGALNASFNGPFNGSLNASNATLVKASPKTSSLSSHTMRIVKSGGNRLMDVVCDDSYAGQGTCRISALLFLDTLVALATCEDSRYIIESLVRLNFIDVLVDSIKLIPTELRNSSAADVPLLLSFIDACLSLLLRISQTKLGAANVLNAGLFHSVHQSQIFSTDPDFGFEIENVNALRKFFDLMLSVLRVINSVVIMRGPQNEHCREQARAFIGENRPSIVSIFKRHARVGGRGEQAVGRDLEDLVDNLMVLISVTDFLEYEEKEQQKPSLLSFS